MTCTYCGFCKSVCPVFEGIGWDPAWPRGRMILVVRSAAEGHPGRRVGGGEPVPVHHLQGLREALPLQDRGRGRGGEGPEGPGRRREDAAEAPGRWWRTC